MAAWTLTLAAALGAAHILARTQGHMRLGAVLKPLPIAILAVAVAAAEPVEATYRALVVAGLLASMAGDVLLLVPGRFAAGLACFLVAHLIYAGAFAPAVRLGAEALTLLVPFVAFSVLVLRFLWPHLGRLRTPVTMYVSVIGAMGWLAVLRAIQGGAAAPSGPLAAVGAVFFMASDTVLAVDRFARPVPGRHVAVMGTYYVAQLLLGLSAAA